MPEETLAAILSEIRHVADNFRQDGWESIGEELDGFADRIEAAAKRERREIRRDAEIEWTRIGYEERKAEEKRALGNATLMRSALTAFVGYLTQKRIDEVWAKQPYQNRASTDSLHKPAPPSPPPREKPRATPQQRKRKPHSYATHGTRKD